MHYKSQAIAIKNLEQQGGFYGYASTFDVDDMGDCILPGAFSNTIKDWKKKSRMPPLLWQHEHGCVIGVIEDLCEDAKGLVIKGRLLLELSKAREVRAMLRENAVNGMSIGFAVKKSKKIGNTRYIEEIKLYECSVVTVPANQEAGVTECKAAVNNNIKDILESIEKARRYLI